MIFWFKSDDSIAKAVVGEEEVAEGVIDAFASCHDEDYGQSLLHIFRHEGGLVM